MGRQKEFAFSPSKERILVLLLFLVLLYVVVPRIGNFTASFSALANADGWYVLVAGLLVVATYAIAAALYRLLALKKATYGKLLLVQAASAFTNRLLPGGVGTLALYVRYLQKHGHSLSQALAVASTNNLLGLAGHVVLLGVVLLMSGGAYAADLERPSFGLVIPGIIVAVVIGVVLVVFRKFGKKVRRITRETIAHIGLYRKSPLKLVAALVVSCELTVCYVGIFYFCLLALGVHLPLLSVFLVFTLGIIIGTATPTPGGVVGAEAGLTAGLVAYDVAPSLALAAALLYRLLTYWLPLLPGFVVLTITRRMYR